MADDDDDNVDQQPDEPPDVQPDIQPAAPEQKKYVTDPKLLEQLNAPAAEAAEAQAPTAPTTSQKNYVTDPDILKQLNAPSDQPDQKPPEAESPLRHFLRNVAHAALPTLAIAPGAEVGAAGGAALGALGGPFAPVTVPAGAFIGGLLGGAASSGLASYVQETGAKDLGMGDDQIRAINAATNPTTEFVSNVAPMALLGGPGRVASTLGGELLRRGAMGGLGAAAEIGQEVIGGEKVDPAKAAAQFVGGAVFAKPYGWVERLGGRLPLGEARPGFPSEQAKAPVDEQVEKPNPAAVPSMGIAREAVPPDTGEPPVTGEPQNKATLAGGRTESEGVRAGPEDYGKEKPSYSYWDRRLVSEESPGGAASPEVNAALQAKLKPEEAPAPAQAQQAQPPAAAPAVEPQPAPAPTPPPQGLPQDPRALRALAASVRRDGNDRLAQVYEDAADSTEAMQRRRIPQTQQAQQIQPPGQEEFRPPNRLQQQQQEPPTPPEPPPPPAGAGGTPPPRLPDWVPNALHDSANRLFDVWHDIQMKTSPMVTGSRESMAATKDFANTLRGIASDHQRFDTDMEHRFTPEQRRQMWEAADQESVLRQTGQDTTGKGLSTLPPDQRAAVEAGQARALAAVQRAKELGIYKGEGLPSYVPRMFTGTKPGEGPLPLDGFGFNLRTSTPQMRQRKYLTAEESEAAAKKAMGEKAELVRDIRTLPMATANLERAIAGRELVNQIKEVGKRTGNDAVYEGDRKPAEGWFTVDHPALKTSQPRFTTENGKTVPVRDANGDIVFDQVPIWIRKDFEGPLKAVLSSKSGDVYNALMSLKGKSMGLIMNSPLIHNAVEWGRALPAMPGKVATFKIYFEGNRAKNDPRTMGEAINAGLVPIGKRFFNQDISSIAEAPNLTPGRSWTAKVLGAVPGLFDPEAGVAVRRAIDRAGDFWHNTLLWDRVGDLQMGLYTNLRDKLLSDGTDHLTASRVAAHWANRYAGALPQEAMSNEARKIANMLMFSRSFTLGNLGVMKDMLTGLPRDVIAQIERDGGFPAGSVNRADPNAPSPVAQLSKSMARRKAMMVVGLDMALMYAGNSLLQSAANVMSGDSSMGDELRGYSDRLAKSLKQIKENPFDLLYPPLAANKALTTASATSENEPGREQRIRVGYTKDGTAIYARNPAGKIGEEFLGYLTSPFDMLKRKLGTVARPAWEVMTNDAGFGKKIYDPNAQTGGQYLANVGKIVAHLMGAQTPMQQLQAARNLVTGQGGDRKLAAMQALGPIAGITFSRGAPGGPAVGEMYNLRKQQQDRLQAEMPDIRKQIQNGDVEGARTRMQELGVPPGLQSYYVRTTQNPQSRLTGRTMRDVQRAATPEQRERLQRILNRTRQQQEQPSVGAQ